jgi:hypothetical protein
MGSSTILYTPSFVKIGDSVSLLGKSEIRTFTVRTVGKLFRLMVQLENNDIWRFLSQGLAAGIPSGESTLMFTW